MRLILLAYIDPIASEYFCQKLKSFNNILICPEGDILIDILLENPGWHIKDHPALQQILNYSLDSDTNLKSWGLNESCLYQIPLLRTNFDVFWHIVDTYRSQVNPKAEYVLFRAERFLQNMLKIKRCISSKYAINFIAILRDCRSIYTAYKKNQFSRRNHSNYFFINPTFLALIWKNFYDKCLMFRDAKNFFLIKHEDLLLNRENIWNQILKKFGIDKLDNWTREIDFLPYLPYNFRNISSKNLTKTNEQRVNNWKELCTEEELYLISLVVPKDIYETDYIFNSINYQKKIKCMIVYLLNKYRFFLKLLLEKIRLGAKKFSIKKSMRDIYFFRKYIRYYFLGILNKHKFRKVETYCMFIGYARSGHSIIGALLDAHYDACISMEADAISLIEQGYKRNQLFAYIMRNSHRFNSVHKNEWTGYSYSVSGQYQGKFFTPRVIGDKEGFSSTLRLGRNIELFTKLKQTIRCRIRVIHIIRHPFDNISSMVSRNLWGNMNPTRKDFEYRIYIYFRNININNELKKSGLMNILDVYHEDLIHDPEKELKKILRFLGLKPNSEYINACSRIVYKKSHHSREAIQWPEDLKLEVLRKMGKYSFLKKYLN